MGIIYKNGTYYGGGGGGAEITIDNELSSTSENSVQNKVIKAELDNKQDADDLMTPEDIDDVVTPLPGVASRTLPRYSTEEQIVGYWIDGKPLYQKTIVLTSSINHGEYINISSNIDKVVSFKGFVIATADAYVRLVPWAVNGYYFAFNRINSTGIQLEALASNSPSFIKEGSSITFQYTKTTD